MRYFKNFFHWLVNILFYDNRINYYSLRHRKDPNYKTHHAITILFIPGLNEPWHCFKWIADHLSKKEYSLHFIPGLKRNRLPIEQGATMAADYIKKNNLQDLVIIAHSKGGLIGKYLLSQNPELKIKKVIAIAAPFQGSYMAYLTRTKELIAKSPIVKKLHAHKDYNHKIVSIFTEFDGYVIPTSNCFLDGAKNVQLPISGHHKILFSPILLMFS